jgi:hypothetical protein
MWRCRVCEGVNAGGRTCSICGAEVPPGEVLRTAVRTRVPKVVGTAPPPVPPTLRRRERRDIPRPEELRPLTPEDLFASLEDIDIRLVSMAPRTTYRRRPY